MGWEKDLPPVEKLVTYLRPFLEHLVGTDLSPKTIQKHVDNVWLLGGEIIRDLNEHPALRKMPVEELLADLVRDGGPCYITPTPRSSSDHSSPLAASSSGSARYRLANARPRLTHSAEEVTFAAARRDLSARGLLPVRS